MSVVQLLQAARETIRDPKYWIQGEFARTKTGENCSSQDPRAYSFCAVGAVLRHFKPPLTDKEYIKARSSLDIAARKVGIKYLTITALNDHGTHKQVLQMFDQAIQDLEEEGVLA